MSKASFVKGGSEKRKESFKQTIQETPNYRGVLALFYVEVCARAEEKMLTTHKLEGAHYAAMKEILGELGMIWETEK